MLMWMCIQQDFMHLICCCHFGRSAIGRLQNLQSSIRMQWSTTAQHKRTEPFPSTRILEEVFFCMLNNDVFRYGQMAGTEDDQENIANQPEGENGEIIFRLWLVVSRL